MALDYALKTFALADADNVHESFRLKHFNQHAVAGFDSAITVGFNRNFADKFHRRNIVLRQMSAHGLRETRFLHKFHQADLGRVVTISRLRLVLSDHAWTRLQHGGRTHFAFRIEKLRHSDFFPQNSCYLCHFSFPVWRGRPRPRRTCGALLRRTAEGGCPHMVYLCSFPKALISTSTPAGRSSFISASTVCGVGSRMSSKRLCVRISNCSRDFLSTSGERSTVYLFFIVGNGIGPAICAPVRLAVATISVVD